VFCGIGLASGQLLLVNATLVIFGKHRNGGEAPMVLELSAMPAACVRSFSLFPTVEFQLTCFDPQIMPNCSVNEPKLTIRMRHLVLLSTRSENLHDKLRSMINLLAVLKAEALSCKLIGPCLPWSKRNGYPTTIKDRFSSYRLYLLNK
jgi:hypothetical protein